MPALRAYGPQDATYRGLRPRQRVYQPFGPMSDKIAIYRGLRPRQRVCRPFGPNAATRLLLTGAFDPGRVCAGPSGLWATRCYLPGPSTPAEGVPALRAYGPQDATYRGLRPRQRVCQPFGPMRPQDATYRCAMYPGRRFALPWAVSFCPFGAAGSIVDSHTLTLWPRIYPCNPSVRSLRSCGMISWLCRVDRCSLESRGEIPT